MLNLVLFGPPGAGKGTQSENLIQKYNLIHLSTGDLLRSQIAAGTELGLQAKQLMDQGLLVPDEVVIGMIESKLQENKSVQPLLPEDLFSMDFRERYDRPGFGWAFEPTQYEHNQNDSAGCG